MQVLIEIDESRFKDIQRIAGVQLKSNYFQTAEQIIANGTPLDEKELKLKRWIEKDIKMLNEIIESGWLISDLEKCPAIDACEDAITALKQYPVLDKVRAEIDAHREKLKIMADDDWYAGKIRGYDCAIEIIDKYRGNVDEI